MSAALEELAELRSFLADALTPHLANPGQRRQLLDLQLAAEELAANIIAHGYAGQPGTIRWVLGLHAENQVAVLTAADDAPRHWRPGERPIQPPADPGQGGLGLWLMVSLLDAVFYAPTRTGNRWRLEKNLRKGRARQGTPPLANQQGR